jgi:glutamate synthase (NADPH) large chain
MALASNYPQAQGLYDPASEHDACGVAMVATLNKVATHHIVSQALTALRNMGAPRCIRC